MSEFRDDIPPLLDRRSDLNIEVPEFSASGQVPCYVPDREGNDKYVSAYHSDYDFE
ncbi:hypothetical protein [Halorubrum halophilum]|uniref:hypothetical protein n=1 Tax=Halorubrum halophilum TaxID=413816 RepID=UPI000A413CB1|nr:hypothetical protein [Halorubrum halophilum]